MSISTPRRASTPIRGVSSGSFTVTRAQSDAPTPLSFLQDDALPILVEETMTLHDNFAQISEIQHAMTAFNESFAAFLYGIKMNAFCVEWPEAPTEATLRAHRSPMSMTPRLAPVAATATAAATTAGMDVSSPYDDGALGDQTYTTDVDADIPSPPRAHAPSKGPTMSKGRVPPPSQKASMTRPRKAASSQASKRLPAAVQKKRAVSTLWSMST